MKKIHLIFKMISLLLIVASFISCISCKSGTNEPGATSETPSETQAPTTDTPAEEIKEIPIIENGEPQYTIVRSEKSSPAVTSAAISLKSHFDSNGAKISLKTDWSKNDPNVKEILIGNTSHTPKNATDINVYDIGKNGFIIKVSGNKILLIANNDSAISEGIEYMKNELFDFSKETMTVPENYCYISSDGVFVKDFKLGSADISKYSVSTSEDQFNECAKLLKDLIYKKCGTRLSDTASSKIILTSESADTNTISAKMSGNDLVICAKDSSSMKKALTCFWFETVAYETGSVSIPSDFSYSKDLGKVVFYSDFNADPTGSSCCLDAIINAHNHANANGYKVFAELGANYYISSTAKTAYIKTDVEWGNAKITVDDSGVTPENRGNWIFTVASDQKTYEISGIQTISRNATNLGITLPQKSIVTIYDNTTLYYIRSGGNANDGQIKRDSVVVDKDGSIDMDAPLMWNFDKITSISVRPIDETEITVSGGIFTTIANRAPSEYNYYARGIVVTRSNTNIKNVIHLITGEGETGAPYNGFFFTSECAYINYENCVMSGHKTYKSPTTYMGSYDIGAGNAISLTFKNCIQSNDITDTVYWGVMGTNYCKNITYDGCVLSRFDAHQGVANATIKNSVIGHGGASVIGYGTLLIENSTFYTSAIINLRSDYGSSWEGDLIIRDCKYYPTSSGTHYIIGGENRGTHNYGYTCYMPKNVIIEDLYVENTGYVYVFQNFNINYISENYVAQYPHIAPEKVTVKGFTSKKSVTLNICKNTYIFANTVYTVE